MLALMTLRIAQGSVARQRERVRPPISRSSSFLARGDHLLRVQDPETRAISPLRCALGFKGMTFRLDTRARASCGIRTHDLPLTERVLCQLS